MAAKHSGSQWPEWMKPGVRVVRGPDWRATIRDPKCVDLGTLSYVPKNAADNKVQVVWDTGQERSYKSGFNGQYELRAIDTQQVGIKHKNIKCSDCSMTPLRGIRFHCPTCNKDLCVQCYCGDKHNASHAFVRFDMPNSVKVNLPPRKSSPFLRLTGVFIKSEVIRGPHWSYTGTDGEGGKGVVMAFVEDKDGLANAWVRVKWESGHDVKEYRFGVGGYVDVVSAKVTQGGKVYIDHLPVIGIIKVKNGDKVTVNMTLKEFMDVQSKSSIPGGWKDEMKQCVSQVGTVVEILFGGDMASVQYTDGNIHIVAKSALYRRGGFREKDAVNIINNKKVLKKLQEGHGGVVKNMENACGKLGRLLQIQTDGDMVILIEGERFVFNPTCCSPLDDPKEASKAPPVPVSDSEDEEDLEPSGDMVPGRRVLRTDDSKGGQKQNLKAFSDDFGSMYGNLMRNHDISSQGNAMFQAFTKADLPAVIELIKRNNGLVDFKMEGGRTILHLACHEGYKDLVTFLIEKGADMETRDEEGDTPLHFAAFGRQPDCVQELLQSAADPNIQNNNGFTPLIISIQHPDIDSVQCLIVNNADVTLRTTDGDTAMHDAIEQKEGQPVIVACVLAAQTADHSLCNSSKFNSLHWAAFKDCRAAVQIIIDRSTNLVDEPLAGEGFTALHIAVVNDFIEVASLLLGQGGADPNIKDNEGRSPLHLAVSQQHKRAMEILLERKANVNAQDNKGDTPLHLSQQTKTQKLSASRSSKSWSSDANIQIVYFLLEKGADLHIKNNAGETPTDLIQDPQMKTMIERLTAAYQKAPAKSQSGLRLPIHWKDMKVTDVELIKLDILDTMQKQEFAEVEKHFKSSLQCEIGSISRIQNALLWEHYTLKKREMESKFGQGCANELHLYHGTRPDLVDVIANQNFDFRMAGSRVGALYGDGAYFATTAKYSDLYAASSDAGYKVMFVAKVLVGKSCLGASGLKRPPEVDALDFRKGCYDATVNNVLNPTIYCVFDKNQYYPEYLVQYR